jgi:hypothetical protein
MDWYRSCLTIAVGKLAGAALLGEWHERLADPELIAATCEEAGTGVCKTRKRFLVGAYVAQGPRKFCVHTWKETVRSLCTLLLGAPKAEGKLFTKALRQPFSGEGTVPAGNVKPRTCAGHDAVCHEA